MAPIALWTLFNLSSGVAAEASDVGAAGASSPPVDVRGAIEITTWCDSNLFASKSNREGDHRTLVSPSLEPSAGSAHQDLLIDAGASFGRYRDHPIADPAFDDTAALDIGVSLETPVSRATRWSAGLWRGLLETTECGASGYLLTNLGITLGRRINDRLHVNVDGYYGIGRFEQTARKDELVGLGASLVYSLSDPWRATFGYRLTRRDAQGPQAGDALLDAIEDYDRHLVSFGLHVSVGREDG